MYQIVIKQAQKIHDRKLKKYQQKYKDNGYYNFFMDHVYYSKFLSLAHFDNIDEKIKSQTIDDRFITASGRMRFKHWEKRKRKGVKNKI